MRALTVVASAAATGLAAGAASRFAAAPSPSARATLALLVVFGLAACMAAAAARSDADLRARVARAGVVAVAAFGAAWIATAVAGEPGVMGACIAVTGAAVLAHGVAALLRARGAGAAHATFAGASVPTLLAALAFVADPFIEWNGSSTEQAPDRAAVVLAISPIASIAADTGVDWQRSKWMYDGPVSGTPGLSVVGRYYPSRPTAPWTWGLAAAACGLTLLVPATPRKRSYRQGE